MPRSAFTDAGRGEASPDSGAASCALHQQFIAPSHNRVLHLLEIVLHHGVAVWKYFGAELDHIPLLLLFLIFYAGDAGTVWGLDGLRRPASS